MIENCNWSIEQQDESEHSSAELTITNDSKTPQEHRKFSPKMPTAEAEKVAIQPDYEGKRRYCGNRFRLWHVITMSLCVSFLMVVVILIPVYYYGIIPSLIRNAMINGDFVFADAVEIQEIGDQTIKFKYNAHIQKADYGTLDISSLKGSIYSSEKEVINFGFDSGFSLNIDQDGPLNLTGFATISDFAGVMDMLSVKSTNQLHLTMSFCRGFICYNDFVIVFDGYSSPDANNIRKGISIIVNNLNSEIQKKYPPTALIDAGTGFPLVHIEPPVLDVLEANSLSFTTVFELENPSKVVMPITTIALILGKTKPEFKVTLVPTVANFAMTLGLMYIPFEATVSPVTPTAGDILEFVLLIDSVLTNPTCFGPVDLNTPIGGALFTKLTQNVTITVDSKVTQKLNKALLPPLKQQILRRLLDTTVGGVVNSIPSIAPIPPIRVPVAVGDALDNADAAVNSFRSNSGGSRTSLIGSAPVS